MGLCTIKTSADFRRVRGGARWSTASFLIEVRERPASTEGCEGARFGFTVTRKLGNAVVRNRIKRRLKEAIRTVDPALVRDRHDYVVVARSRALEQQFADLRREVEAALNGLHSGSVRRRGAKQDGRTG